MQGIPHPDERVHFLISELIVRKKMAALGFTSDLGRISAQKVDAFMVICSEMENIEMQRAKTRR